ncbi:hypothetical protein PF005_g5471 [Phytophthora fragariae]|uniref:RxLR effector protein n=1 Tax=Phytophthora fragariae TaxID=53985 RepID=A0A6A4A490_9STRA|nr:hypothetical protein PF003_g22857 [Phytophthora fragariae]KAE8944300.1 hypothetical protein PF009_g5996 [Phytophthora fragariae]KAE9022457.1 hypothetical protein PF011_g4452 [Phytophthora fragariae]KAE9127389.1 hypothetical protein PF010_g4909 [Phytophthora fragariae]KAE9127635.1 hypothetical protein PF007_g5539 [Phytophthora fragariae]
MSIVLRCSLVFFGILCHVQSCQDGWPPVSCRLGLLVAPVGLTRRPVVDPSRLTTSGVLNPIHG